ncbi:MAG: response regulator [Chloroflexota bacterium]
MVDKPQILIVEDDLDLSEMVSSYFRVQNYNVLTAAWGEEALQLADDNLLDLIMLDIRLPDIDGFELCRRLRNSRRTQDTPIIFLTEKRDRVDKLQGLELGVVDYITKPFDIQELRLRVRNAINRAQMPAANNPVTDLPEGELVNEKLGVLLAGRTWAVLKIAIKNLGRFREQYGFVAADDVLRAVTLMVRNAVREYGAEDDFIGHLSQESFIIITNPDAVEDIQERAERRISQSREYFFPLRDRVKSQDAMSKDNLQFTSGIVTSDDGSYETVQALLDALEDDMELVED